MIVTRTPYRLSLFGGGTDYNSWFEKNEGFIISVALGYYCYLTTRYLPPFFSEHKSRIVYSKIEEVKDNNLIQHPSVNACLRFLGIKEGIEIHHDGDLPARSGLGSSSSFTVGLLNSLYALKGQMRSDYDLANDAIHVEQNLIGESVGVQDQIIAAHGGFRFTRLGPGNKWHSDLFIQETEYIEELSRHILIGYSGISRIAEGIASKKVKHIKRGESTTQLSEIHEITKEAAQSLVNKCEIKKIGNLLDKTWELKKQLANEVSASWMDSIYSQARINGAFGGKLMGAGGGGFFFFLAPPQKHEKIKQALSNIRVWVPFKIDNQGSKVIFFDE